LGITRFSLSFLTGRLNDCSICVKVGQQRCGQAALHTDNGPIATLKETLAFGFV
jgi:hypothetical protein